MTNNEKTDFNEIFKFLNQLVKEKQINLYKFEEFCSILNIPNEIKIYAKELLFNKSAKFNKIWTRRKFLIYISAFFVSYVINYGNYEELQRRIDLILKIFNDNPVNITRYVDLNKIFLVCSQNKYHAYLVAYTLNPQQLEHYFDNIYRIKIRELLKILENEIDLSLYIKNLEELINPIVYIIKECFQRDGKIRESRYGSACYFFLTCLKKLRMIDISKSVFYRNLNISRRTFLNHLNNILKRINFEKFVEQFPEFSFIDNITNLRDNNE